LLLSSLVLVHTPLQNASGDAPQVQAPALQNSPPVHVLPQDDGSTGPQLLLSVCGFTQVLPHWMSPVGHEVVQTPLTQTWPPVQTKGPPPSGEQPPQLLLSLLVLVQTPLQNASGAAPQVQAPALQNSPPRQELPQEAVPLANGPQLPLSVSGFTQLLPHWMSPVGQETTHLPEEQTWPLVQMLVPASVSPQPPQLLLSSLVLVQTPPQNAWGAAPHVQPPALQNSPPVQALPHDAVPLANAPQLPLSVSGFTQLLPHWISPVGQETTHWPALQT
jgi:hypothetical protein